MVQLVNSQVVPPQNAPLQTDPFAGHKAKAEDRWVSPKIDRPPRWGWGQSSVKRWRWEGLEGRAQIEDDRKWRWQRLDYDSKIREMTYNDVLRQLDSCILRVSS